MPISPLRMSVMRGATNGTVKGFQPIEKEVYTLSSKAKAKLGGRAITPPVGKKPASKLPARIEGGPAWQKKDQAKTPDLSKSPNGQPAKPPTVKPGKLKTLPAFKPKSGDFAKVGDKKAEPQKDNGFNKLAAGSKSYGQTGRKAPNIGPTKDKLGYAKRDAKLSAAKAVKASYLDPSRKKK